MKQYCNKELFILICLVWFVGCTANRPIVTLEPTSELSAGEVLESTQTPDPVGISEMVDGWLAYRNNFYGYKISYPPVATLSVEGVSGFPSEEKPSTLTDTQYRSQLLQMYPDDICLSLHYKSGFINILAPFENGGKYASPCPGTGVGDYALQEITESVTVNGNSYIASGYKVFEGEKSDIWHGEFLSFQLEDGTVITFGGGFDRGINSIEDYSEVKEVLLEILTTYGPIGN